MQGVRPIGANNKIFLSEQAPTEYFIIHSCMSHSNSKIVAISTVKHLSRNYASFQQPSVQEWYSLSTSGQAQNIPQRNTADFHGDGYILQNTGHEAEEISFVVCDVNSEKEQLQVKIFVLKNRRKLWRCEDRIGFMPQTKSREKTVNMHKFIFQTGKSTFSAVQEFVMLRDSFIGIAVYQKIENVPWRLSPIKHSRFCVFVQVLRELFIPLIPPLRL